MAVDHQYLQDGEVLRITLRNASAQPVTTRLSNAYAPKEVRTRVLAPGAQASESWRVTQVGHWYDVWVTTAADPRFLRRLAGHIETGRPSRSDPALDWATAAALA